MQKVETVCITDDSEFDLGEFCATGNNGPSGVAWAIFAVTTLLALAFAIWNYGLRQGKTGSSVGKAIMKFKVVSEATGQPIGFGMSIVRQIAHAIDQSHLLHRLPVPAVGREAADDRRQAPEDHLRTDLIEFDTHRPAGFVLAGRFVLYCRS